MLYYSFCINITTDLLQIQAILYRFQGTVGSVNPLFKTFYFSNVFIVGKSNNAIMPRIYNGFKKCNHNFIQIYTDILATKEAPDIHCVQCKSGAYYLAVYSFLT